MSQKSITSFFVRRSSSDGNNSSQVETPKANKGQSKVTPKAEKTLKSNTHKSSPLKETNRPDLSEVDSPIKKTSKRTSSARKRLDSSTDEEATENGSPKQESPKHETKAKGTKRKSSPSIAETKPKKTKAVSGGKKKTAAEKKKEEPKDEEMKEEPAEVKEEPVEKEEPKKVSPKKTPTSKKDKKDLPKKTPKSKKTLKDSKVEDSPKEEIKVEDSPKKEIKVEDSPKKEESKVETPKSMKDKSDLPKKTPKSKKDKSALPKTTPKSKKEAAKATVVSESEEEEEMDVEEDELAALLKDTKEAEMEEESSPKSKRAPRPKKERKALVSSDSEDEDTLKSSEKKPKKVNPFAAAKSKKEAAKALVDSEREEEEKPKKVNPFAAANSKKVAAKAIVDSESEEEEKPKKVNPFAAAKSKKEAAKAIVDSESEEEEEKNTPKIKEKSTPKSSEGKPKKVNPFAAMMGSPAASTAASTSGAEYEEVVKKLKYDPIEDAIWKRGEKTPYLAFAKTLQAIEATSGRLRTIEMLSNYFRSVMVLSPDDLLPSVYLCLNRLAPSYEGMELGLGETLLIKAIAHTTGRSVAQIKADAAKAGDLGIVAESSRGGQRTMFQPAPLTIPAVFDKLKAIAGMTGNQCMGKKVEKIQSMLVACKQSEARYLIRSLAGKLRIGLAEQSVLQALAQACVMTPPMQDYPPTISAAFKDTSSDKFKEALEKEALALKTSYCECPNYDLVIPILLSEGIEGVIKKVKLTPGIPLKPMLAHPTKGVQEVLTRFENAKFTCEWKYDGERAQIHLLEDGTIQIYSRNQENNTSKYPDIIQRFSKCKLDTVKSCVLDSEAVAWDREKKQIQPFQVLSTRKRKDANESEIKVQVAIFAFDLLYLNGEAMVRKPFSERRQLLKEHFKEIEGEFLYAKSADPETMEEMQELLEDSVKENCEGLMVKTLDVDATYEIAKRSRNWLKLKKDYLEGVGDTLDVVVLGGYLGKGKRVGSYGGFLLACYDAENEEYQSICKIGTGFTDDDLAKHWNFFQDHKVDKAKPYYAFDSNLEPDHWFEPVQVWEIKAADLSISPVHRAGAGIVDPDRGISLRFPRFIRIREDKSPEDATSAQQVADMYNSQEQIKNQNASKKSSKKGTDEDFDF